MDVVARVRDLEHRMMLSIEDAAREGDAEKIKRLADLLEGVHRETDWLNGLESRLGQYDERLRATLNGSAASALSSTAPAAPVLPAQGKKQRGEAKRQAYAKAHQLREVERRVFRSQEGDIEGVAYASDEKRKNKWWLGLPDREYNLVALICEGTHAGLVFEIPVADLGSDWRQLSRSGGEVKFNVKRDRQDYVLQVPHLGNRNITRYICSHGGLR